MTVGRIVVLLLPTFLCSWLSGQSVPLPPDVLWSGQGSFSLGEAVPGVVEVRGGSGFPVLKDGASRVFAAAGQAGKGRVVALAHGLFLEGTDNLDSKPVRDFLCNSLRWAGQSTQPKVALHPSARAAAAVLIENGFAPELVQPDQLEAAKPQVYCLISHSRSLQPTAIDQIIRYLESGGGVIVATTPWAFANRDPDFSLSPGNRILSRAGLAFLPDEYCSNKEDIHVIRPLDSIPAKFRNWSETVEVPASSHPAVLAVKKLAENKPGDDAAVQARLIAEMKKGKHLGPEDTVAYLHALRELNQSKGGVTPTRNNPIKPGADPVIDALIDMETFLNRSLPAGMMYPIPAAEDYPGRVPAEAPRVTRELETDCHYKGWAPQRNAGGWNAKELRSTGLYAPPAEVIRIEVPPQLAGKGYEAVIGSYGGGLESRDAWHRYPRLQTSATISDVITEMSSGFGGLVGLRVPPGAADGTHKVKISGVIEAPFYEHGVTSVADWREKIRQRPAPMAELACARIIITLPSEDIRNLENPDEVMERWIAIVEKSAELAMLDRRRFRAERLVFDRQPAAGLLHSGYPMCGHEGEHSRLAVDAEKLGKQGFWGFYHELGHNHQHALWALPGTGETTCNLWSVYLFEQLQGRKGCITHQSVDPLLRLQNRRKYLAGGANFEQEWNVWTALDTYLLIQEHFGWEVYQKTFAEYNALPKEHWPRNQQEINDQWVIRLSRACGMNLAPFWRIWNLPLSPSVDQTLSCLPVWDCPDVNRFKKVE